MARYRFKNFPTTATAISRKIQRIIPQDSQVRFPRAVSQASSPTPAERKAPDRRGNLSLMYPTRDHADCYDNEHRFFPG